MPKSLVPLLFFRPKEANQEAPLCCGERGEEGGGWVGGWVGCGGLRWFGWMGWVGLGGWVGGLREKGREHTDGGWWVRRRWSRHW